MKSSAGWALAGGALTTIGLVGGGVLGIANALEVHPSSSVLGVQGVSTKDTHPTNTGAAASRTDKTDPVTVVAPADPVAVGPKQADMDKQAAAVAKKLAALTKSASKADCADGYNSHWSKPGSASADPANPAIPATPATPGQHSSDASTPAAGRHLAHRTDDRATSWPRDGAHAGSYGGRH